MDPFEPRVNTRPEAKLQAAGELLLRGHGWYVMRTHGNAFQQGFPDTFCCHSTYGQRWIDWKISISFTPAQMVCFPKLCANGSGVWILLGTDERWYRKLFAKPNFQEVLLCKQMGVTYG